MLNMVIYVVQATIVITTIRIWVENLSFTLHKDCEALVEILS